MVKMKKETIETYRSAFGKFTFATIVLMVATLALSQHFLLGDMIGAILTVAASVLILSVIYFSINYKIDGHSLEILSLFSKKEIDVFQISSLCWVQSFYSQPNVYSFSEMRLRVVYGYGQHIDISPKNSQEFIESLLAINPMIQLQKEAIMQE